MMIERQPAGNVQHGCWFFQCAALTFPVRDARPCRMYDYESIGCVAVAHANGFTRTVRVTRVGTCQCRDATHGIL